MAVVRGSGMFNIRVEGLNDLERQFARVGKFPKKYLTKAGREGMNPILTQAKLNASKYVKTGIMRKSISKKMETPNKRNKGVYFLRFNPNSTDHFLKDTTGVYGGKTPKAYYPHSVEYGYKAKKGKVEGKYFITSAIQAHQEKSLQIITDSINQSINNLLR